QPPGRRAKNFGGDGVDNAVDSLQSRDKLIINFIFWAKLQVPFGFTSEDCLWISAEAKRS
ncbi:MAG TPA: hypothetical protein DD379_27105, partial [Cyanobacteria bacterium UBA11162]|nr:hypothetical protein [Cyanobacteria bacterium UBA11162]